MGDRPYARFTAAAGPTGRPSRSAC